MRTCFGLCALSDQAQNLFGALKLTDFNFTFVSDHSLYVKEAGVNILQIASALVPEEFLESLIFRYSV